jgi:stearoyl-CoA desaturase (Delta-9 desaturase)
MFCLNRLLYRTVQQEAQSRPLVLVAGFVHDVGEFVDAHPGGTKLLEAYVGKDATTAFFGGVYDHSNAAHNVSPCPRHLTSKIGVR